MRRVLILHLLLGLTVASLGGCAGGENRASAPPPPAARPTTIVVSRDADPLEVLAAREVRRYVYLRTGRVLPIVRADLEADAPPVGGDLILVSHAGRPLEWRSVMARVPEHIQQEAERPGRHILLTVRPDGRRVLLAGGTDALSTLYAAYRLAEHMGVRFYLHGDVVPDERTTVAALMKRLENLEDVNEPLFATRGIQPFHDFPEGPDWWDLDDYKAVIAQLPKMRMNFFGLHTYPEGGPNAEPTVWIGLPRDVGEGPEVKYSYPSSYQNTLRGNWGYKAKPTGTWGHGTPALFDRDAYGAEVMRGLCPRPTEPEECNLLFGRVGRMLGEAFAFAHRLGVKTCVGTETPLKIPAKVQERLKTLGKDPKDPEVVAELYEGIFRRIMQTYPIDYYWFWTPEGWTWQGAKQQQVDATLADFDAALAAHTRLQPDFTLATCGWVLGPPQDRALFDEHLPKRMPMSCINRQVGKAPVEPGFAKVEGRPQWAIPWLEDDPNLLAPQLWVGRMRKDAADAREYGCTGLLGIHWRTRVLGPNVSALARAAWHQDGWKNLPAPPQPKREGPIGKDNVAHFAGAEVADTDQDPLYRHVRYNLSGYQFRVPDGAYTVTLKFCEPHYGEAGKRVFAVELEGERVIDRLDVFEKVGRNKALDYTFKDVEVSDGWLDVGFVHQVEFPCVAAIEVTGGGLEKPIRVNCGGPAWQGWRADWTETVAGPTGTDRHAPSGDFYLDWCRNQFGPEVAEPAARVFQSQDGRLPEPSTWVHGPGGLKKSDRTAEQIAERYAFVDAFAALEPKVKGIGSRSRFRWWLHQFRFMEAVEHLRSAWGRGDKPAMMKALDDAYAHLLPTVTTTGGLGTVANIEQHILPMLEMTPEAEGYRGPTRLIVPTARTLLEKDEPLDLTVIVLSEAKEARPLLYVRPMGGDAFRAVACTHVARGVYRAAVEPPDADVEYYVEVLSDGEPVRWPPTAPDIGHTVVVMPKAKQQ
ncbi:MAG: malectin domain-containing carbohydrate-binding protein [Phycisphaerae bacterium]